MASKGYLEFECDQDFSQMPGTSCGFYCTHCKKEVVDFTKYSREYVQEYAKDKDGFCGVFRNDQLDDSYGGPIEPRKQLRIAAFVSGLFVFSTGANAQIDPQASKQATEFVSDHSENTQVTAVETAPLAAVSEENPGKGKKKHKLPVYKPSRFYWNKRFPFVHVIRRVRAGAYARF